MHPHSQTIRHELPVIHAQRHCQYQSHYPADQRQSSFTLVETERSIDDLDAFRLQVDGSENCSAHDADCKDDGFGEEEPDGPGHHGGCESPYVGHFAGLVTGKVLKPCDFPYVLQTAVQDHARSAFLCEPEADEDSCEGNRSKVEDPGPKTISRVVISTRLLDLPTQRRSSDIHPNSRTKSNPNNRPLNPKINSPNPLPHVPQILNRPRSNNSRQGRQEPTAKPADENCCQRVSDSDDGAEDSIAEASDEVCGSASKAFSVWREDEATDCLAEEEPAKHERGSG